MELDRRSFLRVVLGAAGAAVAGSCTRPPQGRSSADGSPPALEPPPAPTGPPIPLARPALRLPTEDAGWPSPVNYLPSAYRHMTYIYDTLLWPAPDNSLTPWLATGYERSPDGLTYTFHLRDDVRWQDGQPLTAEDVAFSFEYWVSSPARHLIPQWVIFKPRNVAGARATARHTVEVRLDRPAASFLSMVAARFPIMPRHIWSSVTDPLPGGVDASRLIGSGPYRLDKYERPNYLFVANDDFFLGKPFVKQIQMSLVADQLAAVQAGTVHAGGFEAKPTSGRVLSRFRRDPSFGVLEGQLSFLTALHWNPAKGPPMDDVRFRKACAHAIDRNDMVRRLLAGLGHPGNPGLLTRDHPFHVDVEQYRYSRALANRLLDDGGYRRTRKEGMRRMPNGRPLKVALKAPAELASAAEVVVNALVAVGLDVEIDPIEQVFNLSGDYQMALLFWGGAGSNTDPDFLRNVYSSRTGKDIFFAAQGYASPEFDDLADRQLGTADEAERKQLLARMQQIVANDLPLLPLYYPTPFIVYRRSVLDEHWVHGTKDPLDKRALITGLGGAGTDIRPTL